MIKSYERLKKLNKEKLRIPINLYYEILEPFINQSRKESIVHDKKLRKIEKAQQRKIKNS